MVSKVRFSDKIDLIGLIVEPFHFQPIYWSILGISPLAALRDFDVVKGFTIDYMHNVLLGVVKKILKLFTKSSRTQKFHIPKKVLARLNKRLLSIRPTTEVTRRPRSLENLLNFTANELRSMLLFYLPVCLKGIINDEYIKHFRLLSDSIYVLLQENVLEMNLSKVEEDLQKFVTDFQSLYGAAHMTMNVHLLVHMVENVRYFGALWTHSAFCFESFNAVLLKFITGPTDTLHQIATKFIISAILNDSKPENVSHLSETCFLGKSVQKHENELEAIVFESGEVLKEHNAQFDVYKRLRKGNRIYTSMIYIRAKKKIDYFVGFGRGLFGKVKYYFYFQSKPCAMVEQFLRISENEKSGHIWEVTSANTLLIVNVEVINVKFIYMSIKMNPVSPPVQYIVQQPNNFEID